MKIHKLESIRGFAAIYVMLGHLFSNHLHQQHTWIGQPFRMAQEGVLLFFFLSGFVIYYSWHETVGGILTFSSTNASGAFTQFLFSRCCWPMRLPVGPTAIKSFRFAGFLEIC
jgi:hypothetical protein